MKFGVMKFNDDNTIIGTEFRVTAKFADVTFLGVPWFQRPHKEESELEEMWVVTAFKIRCRIGTLIFTRKPGAEYRVSKTSAGLRMLR